MQVTKWHPEQVQVDFTKGDLDEIKQTARDRQRFKVAHGVRDHSITSRDGAKTHIIGLLGEHAFAKVMGLKVDKKKYFVGNKRADFVIEEVSIEVKTRQQDLSFVKLSNFIADVAVLVTYDRYDYSRVWIQGWTTRHDFRQLHYIDNFGYGDRPCMQPCDLLSLKWLRHYCLMRSRVT